MILSDKDLIQIAPSIIQPFDPKLLNPSSIDIRVGTTIAVEMVNRKEMVEDNIDIFTEGSPLWIRPNQFVLVSTLEKFTIPNDLCMELRLKSSRAREGWNHFLAFWFDPGWSGVGTMELKNERELRDLPLYPGLRMGQVIFHRLSSPCLTPYNGRYQGAVTVEASKPCHEERESNP